MLLNIGILVGSYYLNLLKHKIFHSNFIEAVMIFIKKKYIADSFFMKKLKLCLCK